MKINKQKARRLFNEGVRIMLLPCKCRLSKENMWIQPIGISNKYTEDFDKMINNFEYHNCNNELGKYTHFYIADEEVGE